MAVHVTPVVVVAAAVFGGFCTGFTFYLTHRIIADEGATNAATVGSLLPVVSVLPGAIVLGEQLNPRVVAGMQGRARRGRAPRDPAGRHQGRRHRRRRLHPPRRPRGADACLRRPAEAFDAFPDDADRRPAEGAGPS